MMRRGRSRRAGVHRAMNHKDLQGLIASGEGQLLEFKRAGVSHLGREICAFANTLGGRILIGVTDAGEIVRTPISNELRSEVQSIARNLDPPLMVNLEEVDGVLVIEVPASRFKPHSASGKFYLREGATCQQMNRDEIREFFYHEGLIYFDEKANQRFAWPDDLDQGAYETLLKVCRITPTLDAEALLNNLGLLKGEQMTYAGSLLLGGDSSRLVPGANINCCLFQGTTTRILDQKVYSGDFLSNYHAAVNYLLAHLNTAYEIGFERTEILELPEAALREAILNAMGHRDYRKPGDLQVHLFQDRLEIVNPGGLVGGLTVETLGTRSIPRNPLLFGMMLRMDLVEKVGSGFKRMNELCDKQNCPRPEIQADADWFRMIFRRQNADLRGTTPQVTPTVTPIVTPTVKRLVSACSGTMSRAELQEKVELKDKMHFIEHYLNPALAEGLIERTIPDKPTSRLQKYRLTDKGRALLKELES